MTKTEIISRFEKRADGKIYFAGFEHKEVEVEPFWGDGYRNSHKTNPTEKAPSFKSRW